VPRSTRSPSFGEQTAVEQSRGDRREETLYVFDYFLEFDLCDVGRVLGTECRPLLLLARIVAELECKSDWRAAGWQLASASLERFSDRFAATNKLKTWIPLSAYGYGTATTRDGRWILVAMQSTSRVLPHLDVAGMASPRE